MQSYFHDVADYLGELLDPEEDFTARLRAEESRFVRLSAGRVRQSGTVHDRVLTLDLGEGPRHAGRQFRLQGHLGRDRALLRRHLDELRELRDQLPEDPHFVREVVGRTSEQRGPDELPTRELALATLLEASRGIDLTGLYAAGPIEIGFASSHGHRLWFATSSYGLDVSLNLADRRAVKVELAGTRWDAAAIGARLEEARRELEILRADARPLDPGRYRAYLAPTALASIARSLAGSFGLRAHLCGQGVLRRLVAGEARLAPELVLSESAGAGRAPPFSSEGAAKPDRVAFIERGEHAGFLVSPRSAREFGRESNGADPHETPATLEMEAGTLDEAEVLERLGDGLYLNHLHYLNVSDPLAAGLTGMTRFACFRVEGGRIVGPLPAMRFDVSLYDVLGAGLLGLTRERTLIPDSRTYGGRSTASWLLPGALIDGWDLKL